MFRVAKDLGKTVSQLKYEMGYEELIEWGIYYERIEPNRVDKQDMYLAQIAYMLCGSEKAKFKDFILEFKTKEESKEKLIKLDGKQMAELFKNAFGIKEKE